MYKKLQAARIKPLKKVLVVDNDELLRNMLSKVLVRYLGCEVYLAAGSKEALSFLQSKEFDLLMIDLGLPDMSATRLIESVKFSSPGTAVTVIIGTADDNEIASIKRLGINQIVYKPFKIYSLLETVAKSLIEKEQTGSHA
jgi:DNA-binding NtrC family response regulator